MTQQLVGTELVFTQYFNAAERQVLPDEAIEFLTELVVKFAQSRRELLAARVSWQKNIDQGALPYFISETNSIREGDWRIQGIPADLRDRRVEITGPVERKMVINALNANVKVFMADFEDSLAPSWDKVIDGQINLHDAVKGTISYANESGKIYQLKPNPAVLIARVRGLHLPEKHVKWQGKIFLVDCSISLCISIITISNYLPMAAALIFICRKCSLIRKPLGGVMFSPLPSSASAYRKAPLKPRY